MIQQNKDREKYFDKIFLEILNDVLTQVFGKVTVKVILHHFKSQYGLEWDKIPEDPETFTRTLRKILGQGATLVEDLVIRRLRSSLQIEEPIQDFSEIVKIRKMKMMEK